jgi:hypothetical protein
MQKCEEIMKDVNTIIEDWAEYDAITYGDSIMHRLLELAEWAKEDQDPDSLMKPESLNDALKFLNSSPSLTLSPDGHISTVWEILDHKFIIVFLGEGKTQAMLYKPDDIK